jgi:hypothetical protein
LSLVNKFVASVNASLLSPHMTDIIEVPLISYVHLVIRLYRSSENTNQRILFDIEPSGRHLGTGGQVSS